MPSAARKGTVLALVTAFAIGCGKHAAPEDGGTPQRGSVPQRGTMPQVDCATLFDAPPEAELLCDEHVMAQSMEIHWRSYATTRSLADENARYRAATSRCDVTLVGEAPGLSIASGGRRLETFEKSASYPRCGRGPTEAHRTVVLISEKHDRR